MRAATRASVLCLLVALCLARGARAAGELPPAPKAYFNDYAGLVEAQDAQRLDAKLRRFADETSTQVVVAVFPSLPSDSLEDFTVRAAQAWGAGRKDWDNGAVFFVFVKERRMRIETGYGLEGALPDILAARILDEQVRPLFREGRWAAGLEAGIDGILAATRGEYKAPPKERRARSPLLGLAIVLVFLVLMIWLGSHGASAFPAGRTYSRRGRYRDSTRWGSGHWGGGGFGGGGGGGWGGGGGGGGFSGGGGGFGGGGASSSW
jgi:uncharacterized protein